MYSKCEFSDDKWMAELHFQVEFVKNQRFDVFRALEALILFDVVFAIIKHDEDMLEIWRDHEQIACFLTPLPAVTHMCIQFTMCYK